MIGSILSLLYACALLMGTFSLGSVVDSDSITPMDIYYDDQMTLFRAFDLPEGLVIVDNGNRGWSAYFRGAQVPPQSSFPGWVYGFAFSNPGCTGTQNLATGLITGTCLAPVNSTRQVSYLITCNPSSFTQVSYASNNCNPATLTGQITTPFTCIEVSGTFSARLQCSALPTVDLGAPYILRQYFNEPECEAPLQFNGIRNGACVPRGSGRSTKYDFPTGTLYNTPNCTGPPVTNFTISELGNCSSEVGNYYGAQLLQFPYTSLDLQSSVTAKS